MNGRISVAAGESVFAGEIERLIAMPYRRELVRNEDGTWFARLVEWPGCMTEGDTSTEALENLEDAMRSWLAVQLEDGEAIPPPTAETRYSGRFNVRLSPALHRQLVEAAERRSLSLNSFVSMALAQQVDHRESASPQHHRRSSAEPTPSSRAHRSPETAAARDALSALQTRACDTPRP